MESASTRGRWSRSSRILYFLLPVVQPPVMPPPVMQPPIACPRAIYPEVGGEEGESPTALKHSGKSLLAPAVASSALSLSHQTPMMVEMRSTNPHRKHAVSRFVAVAQLFATLIANNCVTAILSCCLVSHCGLSHMDTSLCCAGRLHLHQLNRFLKVPLRTWMMA